MNKKTLVLGLILIVLMALAYIYKVPLQKWQNNLGKPGNFLAGAGRDKIDKIEITALEQTIVLTKLGERWKFNNSKDFYVAPLLMEEVLNSLEKAGTASLELVSNNQARKSEFKTDGSGLSVKINQADKLIADFSIGDQSGNYGGCYVSAAGSANTYLLPVDLADIFYQDEWRDLAIFSADENKINKIRFQYPNREFTLELKDGAWVGILPVKFPVNQDKIKKILAVMSSLQAAEIPEQDFKKTGLDKHLAIIQASGEGVDNILMLGQKKDQLYYAKRGDSDNIYLIDKTQGDELYKTMSQLK